MKRVMHSILFGCALFLVLGAATAMAQKIKSFTESFSETNPSGLAGSWRDAKAC